MTDSGGVAYVKDGARYSAGPFGGNLEQAVSGVPAAEQHARSYTNLTIAGAIFELTGLGVVLGGPLINQAAGSNDSTTRYKVDSALLLSGMVLVLTGAAFEIAARPHLYDAANIFNDFSQQHPAAASDSGALTALRQSPGVSGPLDRTSERPKVTDP